MLVGDVRDDGRYLSGLDAVRSELAVPMMNRQKLVGVLDLQATSLHAFTPQDRSLLQLIASRVASAIDNARLFRRVCGGDNSLSKFIGRTRNSRTHDPGL